MGLVKSVPFSDVSVLHSLRIVMVMVIGMMVVMVVDGKDDDDGGGGGINGDDEDLAKEQQTPNPPPQDPDASPCFALKLLQVIMTMTKMMRYIMIRIR